MAIDNARQFLSTAWDLTGDLWWIMTEEGAQREVRHRLLDVRNAVIVQSSPLRGGARPQPISDEVQKTIEKVANVIDFTVKFAYYTTKGCWYFTAFNVLCHLFTRLVSMVAFTYFVSSVFFGVLTYDLSKLESHSKSIQRDFFLIRGPAENLRDTEEISLHIRDPQRKADLTLAHIRDAYFHTEQLQESFYVLKYPMMIPLERIHEHLEAMEQSITQRMNR